MRKLLTLIILAGSASLLQADYYDGSSCQGGYNQGYNYQNQGQYAPQQNYGQSRMGYGTDPRGFKDETSNPSNQKNNSDKKGNADNKGYGFSDNQGREANSSDRKNGNSDQELTTNIQDSLHSAFSDKYNNVKANVSNGNVTLTGTVATQDDKNDLDKKVRDMDGVKNVNNQVTVQSTNK